MINLAVALVFCIQNRSRIEASTALVMEATMTSDVKKECFPRLFLHLLVRGTFSLHLPTHRHPCSLITLVPSLWLAEHRTWKAQKALLPFVSAVSSVITPSLPLFVQMAPNSILSLCMPIQHPFRCSPHSWSPLVPCFHFFQVNIGFYT